MGIADSMQAAQQEMMANQKSMQIEMAMKSRQSQMAMQTAIGKERFKYFSGFVGLLYCLMPLAAFKNKNPAFAAPMVPLGIAWCF